MNINLSLMGEYEIDTYSQRAFKSAWHGLCEVWGNFVQSRNQEQWNGEKWNELKAIMTTNFGSPTEPKVSTEQLVAFSMKYFDKNLNDLIEINRNSFKKREALKAKA
jgi:hypothetical protein